MLKIFLFLSISLSCLLNLSAQDNLPKCYNDFKIIQNVDSLERYVYTHKDNARSYMYGLISLEWSREIYKDKFGQDLSTIKTIADEQNDELGKIMGLFLEVDRQLYTKEKGDVLQKLYHIDGYFTAKKDTLGVLATCNTILILLQGRIPLGTEKHYEDWFQKVMNWGSLTQQKQAKVEFYKIYFTNDNTANIKEKKEFAEKTKMLDDALNLIKELPNQEFQRHRIYSAFSISIFYYKIKNIHLKYSLLAYEAAKKFGYNYRGAAIYNLGNSYYWDGQYEKAEKYYNEFYDLFKQQHNNDLEDEIAVLNDLSEIQSLKNNFKGAYDYKIKADSINKILQTKIKTDNISELETKYEVEKKETQNKFLTQEKKNLEFRNFMLISGMITMLFLLSLLYRTYHNLKRSNKALTNAKQEIEKHSRFRERLFSMIAHDLRSPVVTYTGITDMISYLIKNKRFDELKKVSLQLDTTSIGLTNLIDNLLLWAKGQRDAKTALQSSVDVKEIIQGVLPIYTEVANWHNIQIDVTLQDNLKILVAKDNLSLIIRNLLDNAIKNTDQGEVIKISTTLEQGFVHIFFINKPLPIDQTIIQNIQDLFSQTTYDENTENDGLGLGIILINEFVKNNNGQISLLQDAENNLVFKVSFKEK